MLINVSGPPEPYRDPWLTGYDERLRALTAQPRHVAYFGEAPHPFTFRYRVYNMVRALAARPERGISAAWFSGADQEHGLGFIDAADALVISRARYDTMVGRMIARARARGVPVLCDIDDLIFDPDYAELIADVIGRKMTKEVHWDFWFGEIARLGATLRLCDGAITTNGFLAERIAAFAPWISPRIVPNFLNDMQQAVSRRIYQRKRETGFARDGRIHVGYFSGTRTHGKDFHLAAGALARRMRRDSRIVLRVGGELDLPDLFSGLDHNIEFFGLQDFVNLQRLQGDVEFCIAPLQENVFTNCKSELKYFEAAATGTITVASPTFAYAAAIRDGDNGFLARPHQWEDRIDRVIALLDADPARYRMMAERAVMDAELRYGMARQAETIEAAVFGPGTAGP